MKKLLWIALAVTIVAAAALILGMAQPAAAQDAPARPTPTLNEINAVARDLWCPLCNGVRLDNCELQACVQMREVISQKIMAGESKESIKAYFVEQYGDVVLGQPATQGFSLLAWVFPILLAVVGIGWVAYLVVTWQKRRPAAVKAAPATPDNGARPTAGEDDDYARRVERELKQLD